MAGRFDPRFLPARSSTFARTSPSRVSPSSTTGISRRNVVALIDDDQPCLVEREIRHVAEPIVLLAHEDREALLAAEVQIDYHQTTPKYDPEASTVSFKTIAIDKGDIEKGFAAADVIVDGEYRTGHQEQLYIETNGVIAVPGADGEITSTARCSVRTTCTGR
jgi:xanthine dehydrogenase molybdopterin-binding subunit B